MDLKKLSRISSRITDSTTSRRVIGDSSHKSYSELAKSNNGDSLLKKALRDPSMKEISKDGPFTIISNGKEAFLYAPSSVYWKNNSDSASNSLESEGWEFVEQSNQDGEYMWDLFKNKSAEGASYESVSEKQWRVVPSFAYPPKESDLASKLRLKERAAKRPKDWYMPNPDLLYKYAGIYVDSLGKEDVLSIALSNGDLEELSIEGPAILLGNEYEKILYISATDYESLDENAYESFISQHREVKSGFNDVGSSFKEGDEYYWVLYANKDYFKVLSLLKASKSKTLRFKLPALKYQYVLSEKMATGDLMLQPMSPEKNYHAYRVDNISVDEAVSELESVLNQDGVGFKSGQYLLLSIDDLNGLYPDLVYDNLPSGLFENKVKDSKWQFTKTKGRAISDSNPVELENPTKYRDLVATDKTDGPLEEALSDPSMEEIVSKGPIKVISNGCEMFLYIPDSEFDANIDEFNRQFLMAQDFYKMIDSSDGSGSYTWALLVNKRFL